MNQTIEPEIGPCPLCGEEAESHSDFTAGIYTHNCANTKCELYDVPIPKAAWNRLSRLAEQERWIPVEGASVYHFGDILENGYASDDNPQKYGYFIKPISSEALLLTDARGNFWKANAKNETLLTVKTAPRNLLPPLPLPPSKG